MDRRDSRPGIRVFEGIKDREKEGQGESRQGMGAIGGMVDRE
jgi:hypothetical protein